MLYAMQNMVYFVSYKGLDKTTDHTSTFLHSSLQTIGSSRENYGCWSLPTFLAKLNTTDLFGHVTPLSKSFNLSTAYTVKFY